MLWNEIREHIRERLPAIVDFFLFAMVITIITAVLLGLTWLYVNYGMALFLVAAVLIWLAGLSAGRRTSVPLALGSDKPALSGKQAPPPPDARADRPVEPSAHEASTGVAEKEPLKDPETLRKNWRLTPAKIAARDAARG